MRVIIKENAFNLPNLVGKKVVASPEGPLGIVNVKTSELLRVGIPMSELDTYANDVWCFEAHEYEEVEPQFINCSDSNVGKGWEGYYDKFYGKIRV